MEVIKRATEKCFSEGFHEFARQALVQEGQGYVPGFFLLLRRAL